MPDQQEYSSERLPDSIYSDSYIVLKQMIKGVQEKDTVGLRKISDHTIHNASIFQDWLSIHTAMLAYTMSKLVQMPGKTDAQLAIYVRLIKQLAHAVEQRKADEAKEHLSSIFSNIKHYEGNISQLIHHVRSKAGLNKSLKLVDHGLSIAQAAEVTGVTQWQIYKTIGHNQINDYGSDSVKNMKQRLNYAMELFSPRPQKTESRKKQ